MKVIDITMAVAMVLLVALVAIAELLGNPAPYGPQPFGPGAWFDEVVAVTEATRAAEEIVDGWDTNPTRGRMGGVDGGAMRVTTATDALMFETRAFEVRTRGTRIVGGVELGQDTIILDIGVSKGARGSTSILASVEIPMRSQGELETFKAAMERYLCGWELVKTSGCDATKGE